MVTLPPTIVALFSSKAAEINAVMRFLTAEHPADKAAGTGKSPPLLPNRPHRLQTPGGKVPVIGRCGFCGPGRKTAGGFPIADSPALAAGPAETLPPGFPMAIHHNSRPLPPETGRRVAQAQLPRIPAHRLQRRRRTRRFLKRSRPPRAAGGLFKHRPNIDEQNAADRPVRGACSAGAPVNPTRASPACIWRRV